MPIFFYKAKDSQGKAIKGTIEVSDEKQALVILKERKCYPFSLKEKREDFVSSFLKKIFNRVSSADVATFTRQLATMINAGLPLTQALVLLKSQGKEQISMAVSGILRDIEGGSTLAKALGKYPKIFSSVYFSLVKAGESAGVLDNILLRLADNLESQKEFKAKIKGALVYPVIILIGMVGVMFVMMIFVIPQMTTFFKDFGSDLPAPTKILIGISNGFTRFWWLFPFVIFGGSALYRSINSKKEGKLAIDLLKLKIPIAGKLQKQVILAELTRTLGLLIGAGVPITEALEISSKTASNKIIEDGILSANKQVEKGLPLSAAIAKNSFFPPILPQMLSVGEETGKMDEVLLKVSKYFQSESEESLKGLTTAIEPIIMIILGLGVGALIFAIIMPIYSMVGNF